MCPAKDIYLIIHSEIEHVFHVLLEHTVLVSIAADALKATLPRKQEPLMILSVHVCCDH